jgi:hypothetical protein
VVRPFFLPQKSQKSPVATRLAGPPVYQAALFSLRWLFHSRLVIVGELRMLRMLDRVLDEFPKHDFDCLVELRILSGAGILGIELNLDVRCDPSILDVPPAIRKPNAPARSRYRSAVDERWISADADQAAPSAFSDQGAEA